MSKINNRNPKSCFVNLEKALNIIRAPLVTEKSTLIAQFGSYGFLISLHSNKIEIKKAIEQIFNVKVASVTTLIQKGKMKRFRGRIGYRKDVKKAYVKLQQGYTIDLGTGF